MLTARDISLMPLLMIAFFLALIKICVPILEEFLIINKPLKHADALVVMAGEIQIDVVK